MEFNLMTIDMIKTGQRITSAREKAGLSVRDLQASIGLSEPTAIYKWQRGECLPRLDHLIILSAICGVPIGELIAVRTN